MTSSQLTKLAISAGILFAAFKFGPAPVKAMSLAVAGVIAAKQVPYLQDSLA